MALLKLPLSGFLGNLGGCSVSVAYTKLWVCTLFTSCLSSCLPGGHGMSGFSCPGLIYDEI